MKKKLLAGAVMPLSFITLFILVATGLSWNPAPEKPADHSLVIQILGDPYEVCTNSELLPYLSEPYPGTIYYEWSIWPQTGYVEPSSTMSSYGIYLYEPGYYTITCTAYTSSGSVSFVKEHHASDCF